MYVCGGAGGGERGGGLGKREKERERGEGNRQLSFPNNLPTAATNLVFASLF